MYNPTFHFKINLCIQKTEKKQVNTHMHLTVSQDLQLGVCDCVYLILSK